MFGFLNVYKPSGITSHDVVSKLRKITGIKQIGHTGTLDPFAEGVLPICIGKATRLIEYLADDKAYEGVIQFGTSTTTYDREGDVVNSSNIKVDEKLVLQALKTFQGEIEQKPPVFSAIKIKGKKLYEYARSGENVEVPVRKITIYKLELLDFDFDKQQARVYIECSKGTYIRSIANDLGAALGCYGFLSKLIRVKAGKFMVENSLPLDEFDIETVKTLLIPPLKMLDFKQYELNENTFAAVKNGMKIKASGFNNGELTALVYNSVLVSVAQFQDSVLIPQKVMIN